MTIELKLDGTLWVNYKGVLVLSNVQTRLPPITGGRFAFAARNGGYNQNVWIDNLQIQTIIGSNRPVAFATDSPTNQLVLFGQSASFVSDVFGTPAPSIQWFSNDVAIAGATNASYSTVPNTGANNGDVYRIEASNVVNQISRSATLTVLDPVITLQPASQKATNGQSVTFSVTAMGSPPLTYQWWKDGIALPQGTDASLTLPNAQSSDAGAYNVVVTSFYGSATSAVAVLAFRPIFTLHPLSQTAVAGGSVTFSVAASGTPPMSFRWRKPLPLLGITNADGIVIGTNFSGFIVRTPNYSFLSLTNLSTNDAATYTVVVTNIAGTALNSPFPAGGLSSNAVLTVLADSDGDGLPDAFQSLHPGVIGSGDDDNDGMNNAAEYFAGTDPFDPASNLKASLTGPNFETVQFIAVSNRTYTVQYSDTLNPAYWQKLADVLARNVTRTESVVDSTARTNRLYRVVTPSQP
jgi:hypothetical protein